MSTKSKKAVAEEAEINTYSAVEATDELDYISHKLKFLCETFAQIFRDPNYSLSTEAVSGLTYILQEVELKIQTVSKGLTGAVKE